MADVKFYWWKAPDLVPVLRKLGFSDFAIKEANLVGKRLEFHPSDKLFYVKAARSFAKLDGEEQGDNYSHTCPPDCPD